MFSVYKSAKWCFSAELLETGPRMEDPSCVLSESFIAGSMGPGRGARLLAEFLLTSYHLEEHGAAAWLVTLEVVAVTWRHSLFPSFKRGASSETLLLQAWLWFSSSVTGSWVLGKSLNSCTTGNILGWQSGPRALSSLGQR